MSEVKEKDFEVTAEEGLTTDMIQSVLDTLPVSYYLNDDVDVVLKDGFDTYFDPFNRVITIGADVIKTMMANFHHNFNLMEATRTMLYHEVSHVFMTPENFKEVSCYSNVGINSEWYADICNIFEDERMETLLRDFYMLTNFKKNVYMVNNFRGQQPTSAWEDFYSTIRFRFGKREYIEKAEEIIYKYPEEKVNSSVNQGAYEPYRAALLALFNEIAKSWYEDFIPEIVEQVALALDGKGKMPVLGSAAIMAGATKAEEISTSVERHAQVREAVGVEAEGKRPYYNKLTQAKKYAVIKKILEKDEESGENGWGNLEKAVMEGIAVAMSGAGDTGEDGDEGGESILSENEGEKMSEEVSGNSDESGASSETGSEERHLHNSPHEASKKGTHHPALETKMNVYRDPDLTKKLEEIFTNFTSRVKGRDSAAPRYSGRLEPRLVGTPDWRIWIYKSTNGPIRGFQKLHLNIFIDTSGSYYNNVDKTNAILRSLIDIEEKLDYFDFSLVTCAVGEKIRGKNERCIYASGGNHLDKEIYSIYSSLQKKDAFNINVILFDGDAFTDCYGRIDQETRNFGAFNYTNCSIISDSDNESYIRKYAPNAHTTIVNGFTRSKSYSDLLYDNIVQALTLALMN